MSRLDNVVTTTGNLVCIGVDADLAEWIRDALCLLCDDYTEEGGEEAGLPRGDLDALIAGIDSATLLLRDSAPWPQHGVEHDG